MPSSIPKRSAAISLARAVLLSPMRHVPWPSAGTRSPSISATVVTFNSIAFGHRDSGKGFSPEPFHSRFRLDRRNLLQEIGCSLRRVSPKGARVFLMRDRARSFHQRLTFLAVVDDECVVFAMR